MFQNCHHLWTVVKSGRGLPQSKTLRVIGPSGGRVNVLDCVSRLALWHANANEILRHHAGIPLLLAGLLVLAQPGTGLGAATNRFFGIHVVDKDTGRGVPLVELETVNHLRFVTDSAGWVAFDEPGLQGRSVFFHIRSHGYEFAPDGFGSSGVGLNVGAGVEVVVKMKRKNIAERLYRLTGEGIYRDSVLLGKPVPLAEPLGAGLVAGQDSTVVTLYQGKLFWTWGDTSRMKYPLGHFWTAGAASDLPSQGGLDPAQGVNFRYFVDGDGFSRPLCRLGVEKGPIWVDGLLAVRDDSGRERMLTHYTHVESLAKVLDHGLAWFDDSKQVFERLRELDLRDRWRCPHGHPLRHTEGGREYFYFGNVFPNVRVPATFDCVTNPLCYEAWTLADGSDAGAGKTPGAWTTNGPPLEIAEEARRLKRGSLLAADARFHPIDVLSDKQVNLHRGSVRWNEFRKRWIAIAVEQGGTSPLGEVWYSEAAAPIGPWRKAIKIVTHRNYSFYNPVQHPFFDQSGGRFIYFEGTYSETFANHPEPTPRYDYNQLMYRLDLADERLKAVAE